MDILLRSLNSSEGALGSFGAALLEPYSDQPTTQGILIYPEGTTMELVEQFVKNVRFCMVTMSIVAH